MQKLYSRIAALGAAILAVLLAIARYAQVVDQRDDARERADQAEAQIDEANEIAEADSELENEFSDLRRESDNAQSNGDMPDHISDRNNY